VSDTLEVQAALPRFSERVHWNTDVAQDSERLLVERTTPPGELAAFTVTEPDVPESDPLVAAIVVVSASKRVTLAVATPLLLKVRLVW
jgi:hypothetical protein